MEQNNNLTKQFIFGDTFLEVFSDILERYKLKETPQELLTKLETDKQIFAEILMGVVKDFFKKIINDADLATGLKDKLNISKEDSEKLAIEIKGKIIPLIREEAVPVEEPEIEKKPQTEETVNSPFATKIPTMSVEENAKLLEEERASFVKPEAMNNPIEIEKIEPAPRKIRKSTLPKKTDTTVTQPAQSGGGDKYREPIE